MMDWRKLISANALGWKSFMKKDKKTVQNFKEIMIGSSSQLPSDVCRIKHRYFHYRVASLCTIGSLIVWRFRVLAGHWVMMFQRQYSPGNRSYKTLFYPKSVPSFLQLVSLTIWVILRSAIPVKRPFPPSFPKVKGSS